MRATMLLVLITLVFTTSAFAVDDGQTQPRLNYASLNNPGTSADIVATTNGSGNVKGVQCLFAIYADVSINFYVNGGAAQAITVSPTKFPVDPNTAYFT